MVESENQLWSPFQQWGLFAVDDIIISACSAAKPGCFLQFPNPTVLNPVPGSLPIPVCSVISGHSLDAISLKKENSVRH